MTKIEYFFCNSYPYRCDDIMERVLKSSFNSETPPQAQSVVSSTQITLCWDEGSSSASSVNNTSVTYKCKVDAGLLAGIPFFDAALSGKFLESTRKEVRVQNPNATRENAIAWLKFRQWIHRGFEGPDPRCTDGKVALLSPYLITLAEYLGDVQITARFFSGAVVYPTLVEHSIVPDDRRSEPRGWGDIAADGMVPDHRDDKIYLKTNITAKPFGKPIILSAGFYSRDDIRNTLMRELNTCYNEYCGRDITYCVQNVTPGMNVGSVYVCQPEYSTSEWNHGRPTHNGLPLTRMILFECRPLNSAPITWRLLDNDNSSFTDSDDKLARSIGYDYLYADHTINSPRYVFHGYNKWNISDAVVKVSFEIAYTHHWMNSILDVHAYTDDAGAAERFLNDVRGIELKCVVKLAPAPRVSCYAPVPTRVGSFPAGLSEELVNTVCTEFIYSFAKKTTGIGMDKLRKFALVEGNDRPIAELLWESDPGAVCAILRVPKKSHGSASKKKFSELAEYATSILRVKYGFTDTYTFDDGELARLQKQIDELNEKLRPFDYLLRRCGEATLERIGDQYDRCEIDNPVDLRDRLERAERAYEARYEELVKRAKAAEKKTNHSRYDYLCRK